MKKEDKKGRQFKFFSEKNNAMRTTSSEKGKAAAEILESLPEVSAYQTDVSLDETNYSLVNQIGIRKNYFSCRWKSDFLLTFRDGREEILEMVKTEDLQKKSVMEQLELSRRYWKAQGVSWKIIREEDL